VTGEAQAIPTRGHRCLGCVRPVTASAPAGPSDLVESHTHGARDMRPVVSLCGSDAAQGEEQGTY